MKTRDNLARGVRVAHRFPLRASPQSDPSAYLLSPASLLTRHADEFHRLRRLITQRLGASGVILVVSARHGEGRSIAALSLSLAFAQQFARVLYTEADFRRPALAAFFDIPAGAGAADLLWGRLPLSELDTCLLATDASDPPELLDAPLLSALIERLRSAGDWVILDSPPLLSYDDALPLPGLVDGVVIVSLEGRTRGEDLAALSARLARARARVVGMLSLEP
jgi:Mrp family chromosome partitioning ATPase